MNIYRCNRNDYPWFCFIRFRIILNFVTSGYFRIKIFQEHSSEIYPYSKTQLIITFTGLTNNLPFYFIRLKHFIFSTLFSLNIIVDSKNAFVWISIISLQGAWPQNLIFQYTSYRVLCGHTAKIEEVLIRLFEGLFIVWLLWLRRFNTKQIFNKFITRITFIIF